MSRILVTSALPYANSHVHLGHLVEYIQTDIWARFQRASGRRAVYVCADDTHGTAIMIRARGQGRSEEELIAEMSQSHQRDFTDFGIRFDHYGSTHSEANRALCAEFWQALRREDRVLERDVTQLFDPKAGVFLADRFVKGTCPRCGSKDQYGDSCEKCGSTYSAVDLIDPVSTLSGARPEVRTALHLFVKIEVLHQFLAEWTQQPGRLQPEIANYIAGHFLAEPLRDWDVSRPAPYFGFEIPDAPGQYWYVWFDAPIGYMAATREWCAATGENFDTWWRSPDTRIVHFIGKDITYFHTLFWPSMLKAAGYSLPDRVQVHGFLTIKGEKLSKSKGTQVFARAYLDAGLDPAQLRYYYASKLGPRVEDIDLNPEEIAAKVNSDLVGKVVNLASRSARFLAATGLSSTYPSDDGLFESGVREGREIAEAYENFDFARAMRLIMALADRANEYVDRMEPWKLRKDPARAADVQDVCSVVLNLYRQIVVYLAPVLPGLAEATERLLSAPITGFGDASVPLTGGPVAPFSHLMERMDPKKFEAMLVPEPEAAAPAQTEDDGAALAAEPLAPECSIDDFTKVDLRVARVLSAELVPEANKLLKLSLSLGGGVTRTVFAGIKAAYDPESLVGRLVVMVANLAPRTMRFGVSEGMVIASGPGGKEVFLLGPDSGAKPGQRVH